MATRKQKFLASLKKITNQMLTDGNWTYSQSPSGQTFNSARNNGRHGNCAHFVCWALKDAGLIPEKGWFYTKDGKIHYQGTSEQKEAMEKALKKVCSIKTMNNSIAGAKLLRGDIIGWKDIAHTNVYDTTSDGSYLWYDGGSYSLVGKYKRKIHLKKKSYNHLVGVRIRIKTIYFKKYTGKSTSLVDALKAIGVGYGMEYRKLIATNNGIKNYSGTAAQNKKLLTLLKNGKLVRM